MPLIWKTLCQNYLKFFLLTNGIFILTLLLIRIHEIALFATLGGGLFALLHFTFLQFPLILPLAIPLSGTIAAFLLTHKMSINSELTSLRSFGFSIHSIFYPIYGLALLLCSLNFFFLFHLTPLIKEKSKELALKITEKNPLALLQNGKDHFIKTGLIQFQLPQKNQAFNLIFTFLNKNSNRLSLIMMDELTVKNDLLIGKKIDQIHYRFSKEGSLFGLTEHLDQMTQPIQPLTSFLYQKTTLHPVMQKLTLRPLIQFALDRSLPSKKQKEFQFEIFRRLFLCSAPILLTYCGLSFGVSLGRQDASKQKLFLFGAVLFFFFVYLGSKGLKHHPIIAFFVYLITFFSVFTFSFSHVKRIENGRL